MTLPRFLVAIGILHIGEETAVALAEYLVQNVKRGEGNGEVRIPEIFEYFQHSTLDDLQEIRDVGPKVAESVFAWFRDPKNKKLLEKLDGVGVRITNYQLPITNLRFKGMAFVLTGVLDTMSREAAKEKVRSLGGEVSESVSRKVTYLVAGADPGSKLAKAEKLGVKILSEQDFVRMLHGRLTRH